jgi:hypothetical protein
MNERLIELLSSLAASLGTTIEKLWSVYLHQAFVTGVQTSIMFVFINIISFFVLRKIHDIRLEEKEKESRFNNGASFLLQMVFVVLIIIIVVVDFTMIDTIVTCFLNPSYWVLEQILHKIR